MFNLHCIFMRNFVLNYAFNVFIFVIELFYTRLFFDLQSPVCDYGQATFQNFLYNCFLRYIFLHYFFFLILKFRKV